MGITCSSWKKLWFQLPAVLGLTLALCGCHSPGRGRIVSQPPPLDEATRISLGRIGLVMPDASTGFEFRYPMNTRHAMGQSAINTWDFMREEDDGGVGEFFFDLAVAGISGVVGGAVAGVPQREIDATARQLSEVVRQCPLLPDISNRLQTVREKRGDSALVAVPFDLVAELNAADPTNRNYRPLTDLSIDTLIELRVHHHGFEAEERINPPMMSKAVAWVEITRLADGAQLYSGPIEYAGHQHRFREWAADDAKKFRSELKRTGRVIARSIAEQVLVPPRADLN
jgi:hypothetical protein